MIRGRTSTGSAARRVARAAKVTRVALLQTLVYLRSHGASRAAGKALLFLLPSELGFLRYLKESKVPLNEYEFPKSKVANVQSQLEK